MFCERKRERERERERKVERWEGEVKLMMLIWS